MGNLLSIETYQPFRRFMFHPPHPLRRWDASLFLTEGSAPPHVWHPGPNILLPPIPTTIIHCHGNGSDCEGMAAWLDRCARRWNCRIVSWEYAGYGPRSTECPSAWSMRRDVVALFDHLITNPEVDPMRIFVWGQSLGSGPATWLASQRSVAGLILQSPFTSAGDVGREHFDWIPESLCPRIFDNLTPMPSLACPILFIHGEMDSTIGIGHSEKLHAAATSTPKKKFHRCPGSTHNDWEDERDLLNPIEAFLGGGGE
jgi:pimeloyl-ACP methyl ester carboxylesterase